MLQNNDEHSLFPALDVSHIMTDHRRVPPSLGASKGTTFLGFGTSVVERAHYLPKKTQDSPVQSPP